MRRLLLLIMCLAGTAICGCSDKALSVRLQKTESGDLVGHYIATGHVVSKTLQLSPEVSGQIRDIPVKEGQRVRRGQVLVVVADLDQEARVQNLEASVQAATSIRDEVLRHLSAKRQQVSGASSRSEAEVSRANSRLAELEKGPREAELRRLEAGVREASANLNLARKEREALEQLLSEDAVAKVEFDRAVAREEVTLAQHAQAVQGLNNARAGATKEQIAVVRADVRVATTLQTHVADLQAEIDVLEQQLQTREKELARLQSDLSSARQRLTRSTLTAPEDGSVRQVRMRVGEMARYGDPLLVLTVGNQVWIEADVNEEDARFVEAKQPVKVTFPGRPNQEFSGHVTRVADSLEGAPSSGLARFLKIQVELDDPQPTDLTAGLEADVKGSRTLATNAVLVPRRAVFNEDNKSYLLTLRDGKISADPVTLGLISDSQVEVRDGIAVGAEFIIEGAQLQDRGKPAKVIP